MFFQQLFYYSYNLCINSRVSLVSSTKTKEQIAINIVVALVVIKHSTKSRFNRVFIARALSRFSADASQNIFVICHLF